MMNHTVLDVTISVYFALEHVCRECNHFNNLIYNLGQRRVSRKAQNVHVSQAAGVTGCVLRLFLVAGL